MSLMNDCYKSILYLKDEFDILEMHFFFCQNIGEKTDTSANVRCHEDFSCKQKKCTCIHLYLNLVSYVSYILYGLITRVALIILCNSEQESCSFKGQTIFTSVTFQLQTTYTGEYSMTGIAFAISVCFVT